MDSDINSVNKCLILSATLPFFSMYQVINFLLSQDQLKPVNGRHSGQILCSCVHELYKTHFIPYNQYRTETEQAALDVTALKNSPGVSDITTRFNALKEKVENANA